MNQYLITAMDFTDPKAKSRRARVRPAHLESMQQYHKGGNIVSAGAILDDQGAMIGSVLMMQFETAEGLEAYLNREPYIEQKVWDKIDIKPFKVAVFS